MCVCLFSKFEDELDRHECMGVMRDHSCLLCMREIREREIEGYTFFEFLQIGEKWKREYNFILTFPFYSFIIIIFMVKILFHSKSIFSLIILFSTKREERDLISFFLLHIKFTLFLTYFSLFIFRLLSFSH